MNDTSTSFIRHDCPLVLGYPVTGGLESLRLSSDVKRERLIVECFNNNGHAAVD